MSDAVRCVGIVDPDSRVIEAYTARAATLGLRAIGAPGVAVLWDPASTPAVGVASDDDGSFVVLDGELFPGDPALPLGTPDEMAATVLRALRSTGAATGLRPLHLEALVTWWDAPRRRVVVARDHGGVVQGVIGTVGATTAWSSDNASLLAVGVAPVPDRLAIDQLVTVGWVTPPRSYLRDASTIPAGHAATIAVGRAPAIDCWFRHTARPPLPGPEADDVAAFGRAVVDAVARRAATAHLGATLSSGIDSTLLVAVLRRVLERDVDTFTFRYLGYEGQLNEDEFAAETARQLGAPHTVIEVAPTDLADRFSRIVGAFESPVSFGVHSFLQDPIRDAGITAVIGGSDPGFWHAPGRSGALASHLRRVPAAGRVVLLAAAERLRRLPKVESVYWNALLANHPMKNAYATVAERRALFGAEARRSALDVARSMGAATAVYRDEPAELRTAFVFEQWGVPQYVGQWNQRWGRAFGFPVRAPLWDHGVMDVAERRWPWTEGKPLLRSYAATLLPHDRAYAPKVYQEMPLQHWFRGPLRDFVEDALSPARVEQAGIAEHAGVRAILDDHLAGRNRQWPLWQLLTAVEWAIQLRGRGAPALASGT